MDNGWAFVRDIQNGYWMEKPEYSPSFFGDIMKSFWHINPKERPTFYQLAEMVEKYIESLVGFDYFNRNEPKRANKVLGEAVNL
jgi:hypothetical protein